MTSAPTSISDARVRAWIEVREPLERQLEPLGRAAMASLNLGSGQRALDIGCGIGTTPFALAQAVGPTGEVVAIDLLPEAIEMVGLGLSHPTNVTLTCGDAGSYPFEAATFDVAFSRFGVMFFAEPVSAFENIRRALRLGGSLGFVCWRGLDENELDQLPLRAASAHLPAQLVADAATSGPFSFSEAHVIRSTLEDAGFVEIEVQPHDEIVRSGHLQAMVDVCSRVGALGAILRAHPELRTDAVAALTSALGQLDGPGGPGLRAATWVVSARAPSRGR